MKIEIKTSEGRKGQYKGKMCLFTHRDPQTGNFWTDDVYNPVTKSDGAWIPSKNISWVS